MPEDVVAELAIAREALVRRDLDAVLAAINRAEKAWRIETDIWAQELAYAEQELKNSGP